MHKKDPDHYVHVETGSKNRSCGLREMNIENKVVPVYASPSAGEQCLPSSFAKFVPQKFL